MSNSGSIRFGSSSTTGSQNSIFQLSVERYGGADLAATASVLLNSGSTAVAGIDYINIFPYTLNWNDQESGFKSISIQALAPWSDSKVLELNIANLTNIQSGSIMSASVLIQSNILTKSIQPLQEYSTDFTINSYGNLSSGFNRRTQQVPFVLNNKGTGKIKQP
jgi:hypothetical protein